ncbi:MAG: class I SAM-dependent methyltransferase [Flavobacteriaceae bacterium]|nr:class I SAM-dependent methyltransferase [Flavobacteriaceae bacterium]
MATFPLSNLPIRSNRLFYQVNQKIGISYFRPIKSEISLASPNHIPIFEHSYPEFLLRYPRFIWWLYAFNWFTQLRKWYVFKALRKEVKNLPASYHLADMGCGEGQFLFPFVKSNKTANFSAIDKNAANIAFCQSYAAITCSKNCQIIHSDINSVHLKTQADLLLCVGVLQYVENDNAALANLHNQCKSGGKLLLYLPVNGRFILPFYKLLFNKFSNYETVQHRRRIYQPEDVISKLKAVGFSVEKQQSTYGIFGILSHEIQHSFLLLITHLPMLFKCVFALLLILFLPLIWMLMLLDFVKPKKSGNGLLVVARKINLNK